MHFHYQSNPHLNNFLTDAYINFVLSPSMPSPLNFFDMF